LCNIASCWLLLKCINDTRFHERKKDFTVFSSHFLVSGGYCLICEVFLCFTLKMVAILSSKTSAANYQSTRCKVPENSNLHQHMFDSLKSYRSERFFLRYIFKTALSCKFTLFYWRRFIWFHTCLYQTEGRPLHGNYQNQNIFYQ